jgi:2-polyprenyl-6-methoxyphenol hydroxylase-like FAD-dependent oxidoreductase
MTPDYDAIVVGARVAGSITATLLGEYGHKILLLDKAQFPSDTLSTHFFRAPALRSFKRAGVFDQVQAVAPHMSESFTDVDGHTWVTPVDDEDGIDYQMCVRRVTLDGILTERVKQESNIRFLQGAKFTDLIQEKDSVIGVKWTDESGSRQAIARVVIGADGFYSQMAKLVKPMNEEFEPVHRAMYYSYYRDLPSPGNPSSEFYFRGDHLVYVFQTDAELALIAISIPIAEFDTYRKNAEVEMMNVLEALPDLALRLKNAERIAPIKGAGNIPCYLRVPYGKGWALVGDAALIFDPWSGQGIDHASQHAVMLADALHDYLENKKIWAEAMSQYHSERNESSKKNFLSTRKFARDLRPMSHGALKNRGLA